MLKRILFTAVSPVFLTVLLVASIVFTIAGSQSAVPPIYVTLWFDTEDYILPQSDDAAKRLAEMLTRSGIRATFKIVGEKARVLDQRGRKDVIAALNKHEIGYHANTHSGQPTIAVYLQHAGWDDGIAEFYRREEQGVRDIQRIFGVTPTCYGQPGAAWAAQAYPALRQMGVGMYIDESSHVGLDDQPFYYAGMLNVFKMRSTVARMELRGGDSLADGKAKFQAAYEKLQAQGGGTISIYYHPCEWVHTEFWDGVNFRRGANPPRSRWKRPELRPVAETETAFQDFEQYVGFIKAQPGVSFVTAKDLMKIYEDKAQARSFNRDEILSLARSIQREISFQKFDGYALSAADVFSLLNEYVNEYIEKNRIPSTVKPLDLYGPARNWLPAAGRTRPVNLSWGAFADTVGDTSRFIRNSKRLPNEVWIGVDSLSPADYLVTLAGVVEELASSGKAPERVRVLEGRFTSDRYVAEDSENLWGWVIFPEGFRAPKIMELARLQAWTLKPALLRK